LHIRLNLHNIFSGDDDLEDDLEDELDDELDDDLDDDVEHTRLTR
jgi:hypothetical protein